MRGWILDLYPGNPGEMVVWLKLENGETKRLVDRWNSSIFVASDSNSDLLALTKLEIDPNASGSRFVRKQEKIIDERKSEVLEINVKDAKRSVQVANSVEGLAPFGVYRIYNADVPPNQKYLYEHDLFPLAQCEVSESVGGLKWKLLDDVWSYEYEIPFLKGANVEVKVNKQGKIPKFTDEVESIRVSSRDAGVITIDTGSETDKILSLVKAVREIDPDFIFTEEGDTFLLPYLVRRAERNRISEQLVLDRDCTHPLTLPSKPGTSYFSYGKILYKPATMKLYGRIHLDMSNSFVCADSGMEGLYELSRICRMPFHTSSRASIGKALSSLQFYHATKRDILIPWKPVIAEHFKDRSELLVADRGGFIFEPRIGLHENVAELDFSCLFPNIMLKKNLSAETVRCQCCPDSTERIPELGWNVCQKRTGIVPASIKIIVEKRLEYKKRKREAESAEQRERYDARQVALKWLGVTCLPKESPVLVRSGGTDRFVRIGDLIDDLVGDKTGVMECPPNVLIAGVDQNYKAKYCRVIRLIKKSNNQRLLSLVMEDGRKIVTTPDHPFFTLRRGELEVKAAQELEVGEVVPTARKIPLASNHINQIDLVERLGGLLNPKDQQLWRVSGEQLKQEIQTKRQSLLKAAISEEYVYQSVASWIKSGVIPLRFLNLLDITDESHRALRVGVGRREGGRIAWLPAVIQVDERLGFFLGLYIADGSATKTYVRLDIAISEPNLLEITRKLAESLFGISPRVYKEKNAQMHVVQINSASLVRILEKIFGLPGSADKGKLKVPDIMLNCGEQIAHRFMAGLVAGDGHASKQRKFVDVATASRSFQNQIGFLAARLGLAFRMATNRERGHPLYTVNFVGPETLGSIANWEYSKENQQTTIQSWSEESLSGTCNHARYERLPVDESDLFILARATRTSSEPHVNRGSRMCPVQVRRKISRMHARLNEGQTAKIQRIEKLINSDLGFVRIRKIEKLDSCPQYVYCFQLAEDEVPGFFTGEGLVFVHNCFGYLGFNNAKFGRIDAHIGVCAWDRRTLLDAAGVAERRGFEVIHGIVDSLWLKKRGADEDDYQELKKEIETETGFEMSFEGIYKWIAFMPSKVSPRVPVLNRYFGAYRRGELKVRGIEARRHDTPPIFSKCQAEILSLLAEADSLEEARWKIPQCVDLFLKYAKSIYDREIPIEGMVFTRCLSNKPEEYANRTLQSSVAKQLVREGVELHVGENLSYVITDYYSTMPGARAIGYELVDERTKYDAKRYVELLAGVCSTILEPFDRRCDATGLLRRAQELNQVALGHRNS